MLEDKRYLRAQRYLRTIYRDPITGKAEWGAIVSPEGEIAGVHSLSNKLPLKQANLRLDALEAKYDRQFKVVFDAIREFMTPPEPKKRPSALSGRKKSSHAKRQRPQRGMHRQRNPW